MDEDKFLVKSVSQTSARPVDKVGGYCPKANGME